MSDLVKGSNTNQPKAFDVRAYLDSVKAAPKPRGRVIFALDATASRSTTWKAATKLQIELFGAASNVDVQLVLYRGHECRASRWFSSSTHLADAMRSIHCVAGGTQIRRVLAHALKVSESSTLTRALVFVGDCFEEKIDELAPLARTLGEKRIPIFMIQECGDENATSAFRQIAEASGGAHFRFDANAIDQLRRLLRAIGEYVQTGNATALKAVDALCLTAPTTKLLKP